MTAPLSPRDRVSAVLDCFDFPQGERPEINGSDDGLDPRAWADFSLNDLGDEVDIQASGEASVSVSFIGDISRAKRVAAFLNTLDGEG